ncbi:hypothetical protein [Ruminococcus sp.]|nr:hypothetical protein [Ruminococcus sp.]MBP5592810.1 hypothetical protein [Clostridia bacterium]
MKKRKRLVNDENTVEKLVVAGIIIAAVILCFYFWADLLWRNCGKM